MKNLLFSEDFFTSHYKCRHCLVINTSLGNGMCGILLPKDEPKAENSEYMYSDIFQICKDNKDVFLQPSRKWSMKEFTEEEIECTISTAFKNFCEYVDATPEYTDYFEEARTKHPELRPYLKHLL